MSDKQSAPSVPPLTRGGVDNADKNVNQNRQETNVQKKITNVTSSNTPIKLASSKIEQVISASHSTSNQSGSVSRIVNSSDPIDVVKVSDAGNAKATVASSTSQNTKIGLTNSPKLVRTPISSMILPSDHSSLPKDVADPLVVSSVSASLLASQVSPSIDSTSPPPAKKCKLEEDVDIPIELAEPNILKQAILDYKLQRLCLVLNEYRESATELFFLQNGGNILDYDKWKKDLPTVEYSEFMKKHQLGTDSDEKRMDSTTSDVGTDNSIPSSSALPVISTEVISDVASTSETVTATSSTVSEVESTMITSVPVSTASTPEVSTSGDTLMDVSTTLPPAVAESIQKDEIPIEVKTEDSNLVSNCNSSLDKMPMTNNTDASLPNAVVKLVKLPVSTLATSPTCDTVINNQENIVEKAKQEAYVVQRIAELQREGLWSEKRLPKVQEPPRQKAHWDYLLEEMVWLSADFAQERKWKKNAAKKCARMVQKYFQEKAIQAQKAEKLEELKMKKLASFVAKEIKTFWANVEKLVEYKQQTRLEEKRKKALDQHLNFIVDQTEKYSSWLTEGLNKVDGNLSTPASIHSSRISSPIPVDRNSDDDFKPNQDSDDDEETIAKAEEEMKSNHKEEVELLKKESELTLEDLLKELPPNYLEERDKSLSPLPKNIVEEEKDDNEGKDTEFTIDSNDSSEDEEDTIQEQEKMEQNVDHKQELDDLKAENEMSIDELMAMYGNAAETSLDFNETDNDTDSENEDESKSESDNKSDSDDEVPDDSQSDDEPVGLKSLLEDLSDENKSMTDAKQSEMDSVAAIAESLQPKGNTLLTTSVVTKIPFLLKHTLREYQHIGLDWLVTMFERKLNGILADEMGLGKTIQTIALLGHLACEKGNWGPHLIIVPTSVMLNWEMEFKKWCPGFKILTYYGSQKERKQKRTGWTKPNAFHVCITSYKLVIQDHQSFRRKKWKYLILDEAQNIKNFKSQRWQLLLNFQTQRRLLLTGTPLQNNLMELWSLMHFLMPNVFQSHREFKEWFSNPVSGMIEGNNEYNENIIRRLHKVLRPFLLRRLKCEVEKQLPKKYEHVVMCRLSKRQRYLYDDFMSRAKTKETLASGNLLSVINVLMQLRKVCNHPNLFESRPTISPFQMEGIDFHTASLVWSALDYDPLKHIDLSCLNLNLVDLEFTMTAFVAHRIKRLKTPRKLIEEIDSHPPPPPRCPAGKIKINVRLSNQVSKPTANVPPNQQQIKIKSFTGGVLPCTKISSAPLMNNSNNSVAPSQGVTLKVASGHHLQGYSVQLVPHQGTVKAIPVTSVAQNLQNAGTAVATTKDASKITTQAVTVKSGDTVQKLVPGIAQLVQTSTGRHIIITNTNQETPNPYFPIMTSSGQRLTVFPKQLMSLSPTTVSVNKVIGNVVTSSTGRPVMRVSPINVNALSVGQSQPQGAFRCGLITRTIVKDVEKNQSTSAPKSEFHLLDLEEIRRNKRHNKLVSLANINERKCAACPVYGEDLTSTLKMNNQEKSNGWNSGWLHCSLAKEPARTRRQYFSHTTALAEAIKSTECYVEELRTIFEKFLVHVPAVLASSPKFHVSHPPPHKLWKDQRLVLELKQQLDEKLSILHPIASSMLTQFPDPRLIQYDCGKLQSLDQLLRKLKSNNHRVLIFTQMTRMLDVLEAFLNYHGYIYLRLDGATKIDQRQVLMERFNNDKRIFCFILSTRSGGVGVNLTGADTVVFYDSDWNPTMDAQAQDRCHRIGQTRDVHIYRLISERTIEENILKKANQKRLLGDLAIEGGNFTTAYFKSSTIQDLFNVDQSETDASTRMAEVLEQSKDREKQYQKESTVPEEKLAIGALESALAAVEEDLDVQAAKTAKAEAVADLAEFDENIPVDDVDNEDAQVSKAEQEVQNLVSQLTPIERYAMRFVEDSDGHFAAAQLAAAERELEEQKKEWELDRLRALREEEERQARLAEDDDENLITYSQEDARNQIWISEDGLEEMPMWCPPTPPTSDNDVYVDYSLSFLYDDVPMTEAQLPPIYAKKDLKRSHVDIGPAERDGRRPTKIRVKEDMISAPRSLFDRPSPAVTKMRRDMKLHKHRGLARMPFATVNSSTGVIGSAATSVGPVKLASGVPKSTVPEQETCVEWMIHEDNALLQAVQVYQGLPLNLMILSPGHTPNWDLVADIVNNISRCYRSPKQCRLRYETVIVPREEGKILYDTTPKKQKKQKTNMYKIPHPAEQQNKTNRPMRTSQLYAQDQNHAFTNACLQRIEALKAISVKRTQTVKSLLTSSTVKVSKHPTVAAENSISYDNPLSPIEVAARRAERLAKEKRSAAAVTAGQTPEQQAVSVRLTQHQLQQQQHQQLMASQQNVGTSAVMIGQNQVATTVASLAMKAGSSAIVVSSPNVVSANMKARVVAGALGLQDVRSTSGGIISNVHAAGQRLQTAAGISTAGQTPAVIAQKNTQSFTVNTRNLTPAQIQYVKQQQLLRHQHLKALQVQAASGQKVSVAVSPAAAAAAAAAQQQRNVALLKQAGASGATLTPQQLAAVTAVGKQAIATRQLTESEIAAALLKRQQQQQQIKSLAQVQVPGQAGITGAQVLAQSGLQVQQLQNAGSSGATPVATLVKTGGTVRTATPQQIRHLQLHPQLIAQRKLPAQKVAQLAQVAGKPGLPAQLIVQQKSGLQTQMTVQQLQQVMKQGATVSQFTHVSSGQVGAQPGQVVLAKSPLQTRVIPVSSGTLKQTIQVVAASSAQLRQAPVQGNKPIVTTARASPGPSQVRLQTISQQTLNQQQQQQLQQQTQQQLPPQQTAPQPQQPPLNVSTDTQPK